jgi:hypothetical protein
VCSDYNDNIAKATTIATKKKWQEAKLVHLNDVSLGDIIIFVFFYVVVADNFVCCFSLPAPQVAVDRAGYHYRIQRSIQFKESLSLVVDGADMARYSLPYFCVNDKETSEGWRIPTRMYGGILHGEFSGCYVFPAFFPGGTNVVIEVHLVVSLQEGICHCYRYTFYTCNCYCNCPTL